MLRLRKFYRKYRGAIELLIVFFLAQGIWGFSYSFGLIVILSTDVLKTLVEAEATILGFFGLIAVYVLTAFDNRIDRLYQAAYDMAREKGDGTLFRPTINQIKEQKRKIVWGTVIEGGVLFISFFLSIMALGIISANGIQIQEPTKMNLAYQMSQVASMFLFLGILGLLLMLLRMGRGPEDKSGID